MAFWWEIGGEEQAEVARPRAIAYYRHSAQDRQENSIPIQRDQVTEWAEKNGVEIIKEFVDPGRSGLNAEGRPGFNEMMDDWVKEKKDFDYVLCLDVSRWGRFQDIDLSAQYSAECKKNGKQVIYTTIGKPRENDPLYPVYIQFERFRAAQYSRELSDKVWRGCVRIAEQGYWAGGAPPYGLKRLLLDEKREPLHILASGQRKGIQNQRVTLVNAADDHAAVILRIYNEFTDLEYSEHRIAEGLNTDGIPSPGGRLWTGGAVLNRLRNEKYIGTMLYNQTSQKLKSKPHPNPPENWVRAPEAFEGIISPEQFIKAHLILEKRRQKYEPSHMINQLELLWKQYGLLRSSLLRQHVEAPSATTYAHRFGSLDLAFQQLFQEPRSRAKKQVHERICQQVPAALSYRDFLVLDEKLTVAVQPSVPVPHGYTAYWPFRPDKRPMIDITLGVLLSEPEEFEILGYVALPRLLAGEQSLKISPTSSKTNMFGRHNLNFLSQLL
jgi:DNA invertase Pin-like site-specific DNA recombinase